MLMMFLNGVSPQRIFILKFLLAIEAEMVIQALPVVQMEVGFRFEDLLRERCQMSDLVIVMGTDLIVHSAIPVSVNHMLPH